MQKSQKMVLPFRSYTLASLTGHVITFHKGVSTHVPAEVVAEAAAIGAIPADGTPIDVLPEVPEKMQYTPEGEERKAAVLEAVRKVIARNDRTDFNATGVPTTKAVTKAVGYKVSTADIAGALEVINEAKSNQVDITETVSAQENQ